MSDWKIKDYEARCYNLLLRLGRINIERSCFMEREINSIRTEVKHIMKAENCDRLTALTIYKNQLAKELAAVEKS